MDVQQSGFPTVDVLLQRLTQAAELLGRARLQLPPLQMFPLGNAAAAQLFSHTHTKKRVS